MGGARNSLPKSLAFELHSNDLAKFPVIPFDLANAEVERLARELDITNADNIALWLEENLPGASIAWLACRIVEAHEAALTKHRGASPAHHRSAGE